MAEVRHNDGQVQLVNNLSIQSTQQSDSAQSGINVKVVGSTKVVIVPLALLDAATKVNVLVGLASTDASVGLTCRVLRPLQGVLQHGIIPGVSVTELSVEKFRADDSGLTNTNHVERRTI